VTDGGAWDRVTEAASTGEIFEGRIVKVVFGGLVLDLDGVRAFLPAHLIEERAQDIRPAEYADATMRVVVIELNRSRNNCVVSRRAAETG
jgi:small subunit ribosomal protein S1